MPTEYEVSAITDESCTDEERVLKSKGYAYLEMTTQEERKKATVAKALSEGKEVATIIAHGHGGPSAYIIYVRAEVKTLLQS